ncbi:hypothetical protein GCM10022393_29030 [Aquimarina addita]|uniref:Lipocalin-like domain-containing protein n=1 Tax=Aquimarina addita TaxID=870485 RepID=A0ABP6UP58_9FLAO
MKNLYLLLVVIITAVFISCDNEDTEDILQENVSIIGNWEMTSIEITDGTSTTEFFGEAITLDYTTVGKDIDYTVTFSENPNVLTGEGGYTAVVSTTYAGQTETQEETISDFMNSGAWRKEGNILYTTTEEVESPSTIKELTENTMTVESIINQVIVDPDFGLNTTVTGTLTYTLER